MIKLDNRSMKSNVQVIQVSERKNRVNRGERIVYNRIWVGEILSYREQDVEDRYQCCQKKCIGKVRLH